MGDGSLGDSGFGKGVLGGFRVSRGGRWGDSAKYASGSCFQLALPAFRGCMLGAELAPHVLRPARLSV